jgi:hypothetical protein
MKANRPHTRLMAIVLTNVLAFPQNARPASASPGRVAPAVAAGVVIIQVAAAIKGFFDAEDQKRTQQEILQKLSEIQNQLNEIDNKLDLILQRFAELEFHIDQKFEQQRTVDVITAIREIDQHYATWTTKGYKPGRNAAVPEPGPILQELRRKATALRETPSYANFATAGLAMVYERLLLVRVFHVKPDDLDMQRGFGQYASYFRDAAGANAESRALTVGNRWSVANADWTAFTTSFNGRPNATTCDSGSLICCENPTNWWYVGKLYRNYSGDLLTGFTLIGEQSNLLKGPGGTAGWLCYNSENPVYPRRSSCPRNVGNVPVLPCDLDEQHKLAVAKKQTVDDLDAALDALRQFYDEAEEWSGIPQKDRKFPDPRPKFILDQEQIRLLIENPTMKPSNPID